MAGDRLGHLGSTGGLDPVARLFSQLPPLWHGPIIGPGIADWASISENGERRIDLTGLPDPFPAELAWMAHWQALDGTRSSVLATNQLANILRRAARDNHPFPGSMRDMDWDTASGLQGWFYATRWGRLPPAGSRARLRVVFRFARLALLARCHDGPWWALDDWHPRCDPRIPLTAREPQANYGCSPGQIAQPWLREAVKWHLGTMLEAGTLRWTTVSQERLPCLLRFDRWLATLDRPGDVLGDPAAAAEQAAAFRRWDADPGQPPRAPTLPAPERRGSPSDQRRPPRRSPSCSRSSRPTRSRPAACWGPRRAGRSPTRTRPAGSARSPASRTSPPSTPGTTSTTTPSPRSPPRCPLLGLPREQQMQITRGDGTQMLAHGLDDPQAMRMILLQILTGRRASEIRTCAFDCLSPLPDRATATGDDPAARQRGDRALPLRPIQDRRRTGQHPRRPRGHPGHRGATAVDPGAVRRHRATLPVHPAPGQPHRHQALPVGHLRLDAARVQQHREDHRQQGAAGRFRRLASVAGRPRLYGRLHLSSSRSRCREPRF